MKKIKQEGEPVEKVQGNIENDTLYTLKGLFKILNKSRKRGITVYNVKKI